MRHEAIYETHPNVFRIDDSFGAFDQDDNLVSLDESLIQAKIAELKAAEPMRLLKEERNRLLAETDWRFRIDLEPSQAWYEYCQELRDLPANSDPQLDENGQLVNVTWPTPPEN